MKRVALLFFFLTLVVSPALAQKVSLIKTEPGIIKVDDHGERSEVETNFKVFRYKSNENWELYPRIFAVTKLNSSSGNVRGKLMLKRKRSGMSYWTNGGVMVLRDASQTELARTTIDEYGGFTFEAVSHIFDDNGQLIQIEVMLEGLGI